MAQSRLHKVASIFSRVTQLHRAQNLPEEDLPLWYNIYKNFPPKFDPKYNRLYEKKSLRPIFYKEDAVRARFQKDFVEANTISLHNELPSVSQQFIEIYNKIQNQEENISEDHLYQYAVNEYRKIRSLRKYSEIKADRSLQRRLRTDESQTSRIRGRRGVQPVQNEQMTNIDYDSLLSSKE